MRKQMEKGRTLFSNALELFQMCVLPGPSPQPAYNPAAFVPIIATSQRKNRVHVTRVQLGKSQLSLVRQVQACVKVSNTTSLDEVCQPGMHPLQTHMIL